MVTVICYLGMHTFSPLFPKQMRYRMPEVSLARLAKVTISITYTQ